MEGQAREDRKGKTQRTVRPPKNIKIDSKDP